MKINDVVKALGTIGAGMLIVSCGGASTTPANQAPSVSLSSPAPSVNVGVALTLTATANDSDGSVAKVEFFENGAKIGEDTTGPYTFDWIPAVIGTRNLTAVATDNLGLASAPSGVVAVAVVPAGADTQKPVATLTAPAAFASGLSNTVPMTATATDNVGVTGVEFQIDGQQVGGTLTAAPYSVALDTTLYASGQHVVRARARDAAGNLSAWSSATVQFGGSRTQPTGFTRSNLVTTLTNATAFVQRPDGSYLVAEQGGALRVVQSNGTLVATPFITLASVDSAGERGLIGVTLHPDYANNRFVYLYYTSTVGGAHNTILRVTANPNTPNIFSTGSEVTIADLPALSGATNHNGGSMHFGIDGKLYVGVGDNANGANSQSMATRLGKMLRLNDDGTIPTDNPFFATATGDNRSIWATGLRNPFTFAVHPVTGRIHINDVGESTWEEINLGTAAANYGWPNTEGPTTAGGVTAPLYAYKHSTAAPPPGDFFNGCAITGGAFYPDTAVFPVAYRNSYYFADNCSGFIARLDTTNGNAAYSFGSVSGGPVDMLVAADGALNVLTRSAIVRFTSP